MDNTQKIEAEQNVEGTKGKRKPLRWESQSTEHLLKLVCEELQSRPKSFERPTPQKFYKKVTSRCPKLQKKCWTALRNKMRVCRVHYIKARKWTQDSGTVIRAFGGGKAVQEYLHIICPYYEELEMIFGCCKEDYDYYNDDSKSSNNCDEPDLSIYYELLDKLLKNKSKRCDCCIESNSVSTEKEGERPKKDEIESYKKEENKEVEYKEEVYKEEEYKEEEENGISVAETQIIHADDASVPITDLKTSITNQSEEICDGSICSFNRISQNTPLDDANDTDLNKKSKKSVNKKSSSSRLALEKKKLEVEHQKLELERKKFEWQQQKECCELKLRQEELERLFELKKCELAKEERMERERMQLQMEHDVRLKKYEMDMKVKHNRNAASCRSCNILKNRD